MKTTLFKSAALFGALMVCRALALPQLQLDIVDGVYDPLTQTTMATDPVFTVRALSQGIISNGYYVSVAIEPMQPSTGMPDIGVVKVDGISYSSTINAGSWNYGTPPLDSLFADIPTHGQFPTYYLELGFAFNPLSTVMAYNVQDGSSAPGNLYYHDFLIDISGLESAYSVHFDLYDEVIRTAAKTKKGITILNTTYDRNFAPFSHDAEGTPPDLVPDGGFTLALFGLGLVALWGTRRLVR